uniref:PE-PGRS family protein n=1 Tax=Cyanothece sp. (strain PCC 7425 / ATCC 29141) TaxID=395961 RepID=B8HYQ0_CYAP4
MTQNSSTKFLKTLAILAGFMGGSAFMVPALVMSPSAQLLAQPGLQHGTGAAGNPAINTGVDSDYGGTGGVNAPTGYGARDTPPSDSASYGVNSPNVDGPAAGSSSGNYGQGSSYGTSTPSSNYGQGGSYGTSTPSSNYGQGGSYGTSTPSSNYGQGGSYGTSTPSSNYGQGGSYGTSTPSGTYGTGEGSGTTGTGGTVRGLW